MRKAVLYIAMSLDGYIADKNGGVRWLADKQNDESNMGSYPEFLKTVDTVVLGYRTYHQIVTELSPGAWAYKGKTSYVITHRQEKSTDEIIFTAEAPAALVARLQAQKGKDIWICGGAAVANQLIGLDLIDRYHITVIPTILGDGVRLFQKHNTEKKLRLVSSKTYSGLADLVYERGFV